MENVYVLMAYVAVLITLAGCVVVKVSDILEEKRDEKYYYMIKDDAAFWQMKLEQTAMNVMEWVLDEGIEKVMDKSMEMTKKMTDQMFREPEEADEEFKKEFDELDGDLTI